MSNLENIRCYDNNGETADRYTVVFMDQYIGQNRLYEALGMSTHPFHPQGIGQHCHAQPGRHLGRRIKFCELPEDCQRAVMQDLAD